MRTATFVRGMLLAGIAGFAPAAAQPLRPLTGIWVEQGPLTTFRFEPCGKAICGVLVDSPYIKADADARDANNPDPALRARRLKGLTVLSDLTSSGPGWAGRIYFPSRARTYDVRLDPVDARTLTLSLCLATDDCHSAVLVRSDGRADRMRKGAVRPR